jgi:hypothetical protein
VSRRIDGGEPSGPHPTTHTQNNIRHTHTHTTTATNHRNTKAASPNFFVRRRFNAASRTTQRPNPATYKRHALSKLSVFFRYSALSGASLVERVAGEPEANSRRRVEDDDHRRWQIHTTTPEQTIPTIHRCHRVHFSRVQRRQHNICTNIHPTPFIRFRNMRTLGTPLLTAIL